MNRNTFIRSGMLLAAASSIPSMLTAKPVKRKSKYRLLRHATLEIRMSGLNILVDPMLSQKNAMDPVANAANASRIPMVDLPMSLQELKKLLEGIDAVLITHLHRDHWDNAAQQLIGKQIQVFCQPPDADTLRAQGFIHVTPVNDQVQYNGIVIARTGGHHGTGEIGKRMGQVSGFVLSGEGESVYIAGDTIWCDEVNDALVKYQPDTVVVNTGAPRYLTGDPITMDAADVIKTCRALPKSKIVGVHMEVVNHCTLNRTELRAALAEAGLANQVSIPADGEWF